MGVRWKPFILCYLTNRLRGFSSAPGRDCRHKGTRLRRCNLKRKAPAPSPLFLQKRMQVIENKALLSETTRLPGAREVPPPLCFSQVWILKVVKVLYFDTLLQNRLVGQFPSRGSTGRNTRRMNHIGLPCCPM